MQIPVIKQVVENYSLAQLQIAEQSLYEGNALQIEIGGIDEGEQLTHVLAAQFILEYMEKNQAKFSDALRAYTQKVRNSIG